MVQCHLKPEGLLLSTDRDCWRWRKWLKEGWISKEGRMGYQSLRLCWDGLWCGTIINTLPSFFQKYRPASVVEQRNPAQIQYIFKYIYYTNSNVKHKHISTQNYILGCVLVQVKPCCVSVVCRRNWGRVLPRAAVNHFEQSLIAKQFTWHYHITARVPNMANTSTERYSENN